MRDKVEKSLDRIRPALQNDGGNVELVDVDEATGVVKVKLVGACGSCPMSQMTLRMGVERVLREDIPRSPRYSRSRDSLGAQRPAGVSPACAATGLVTSGACGPWPKGVKAFRPRPFVWFGVLAPASPAALLRPVTCCMSARDEMPAAREVLTKVQAR